MVSSFKSSFSFLSLAYRFSRDSKNFEWLPYDRSSYIPPAPPKEDLNNYFYIDVRYMHPDSTWPFLLPTFIYLLSTLPVYRRAGRILLPFE